MLIKTQYLAYNLEDRNEFKMHIHKLLELKIIRNSNSIHRSCTFIVNNHRKQKRKKK